MTQPAVPGLDNLRAIVFDFDLTLVDSREGITASHFYALQGLGLPDPERNAALATTMVGAPLEAVFQRMFPNDIALTPDYTRLYHDRADEVATSLATVLPGVGEALLRLHDAGLKLGIVSTKLRHRIESILEAQGLSRFFSVIVGPEDSRSYKPDPTGLLQAIERLKATPAEVLYVGDTLIDAETARRAGVSFAAVTTGYVSADQFGGYQPVAILPGVSVLPALLGK